MDIKITELLGTRLQGEPKGTKDFGRACEVLSGAKPGELVTLNFAGVEMATASWMSAMLLPLLRWAGGEHVDLYFVLRNGIGAEWLSDLKLVARYNEHGFLVCGPEGSPARAVLVGPLDVRHRKTLELVLELGEATGAELGGAVAPMRGSGQRPGTTGCVICTSNACSAASGAGRRSSIPR